MSEFYQLYYAPSPKQIVGPVGSTPAFRGVTGHGVGTAYGNAYSYSESASAVAEVRKGSAADTTYSGPMTLDCDERCKYLPAAEAYDCSMVCGVLRY